ncbi:hypothetical protein I7G55_31905 [Sinorhizobium meliloti]|uniref:hypothetical protein n=1 Tax=Rhizobium meliloti TaxID=382 RepID=UPI00037A1F17|nr:hypothetical protein [Sinorhizobium meliloti]MDE3878588.1 hypothetical protein [Sinorhizobium meliloti]
MAEILAAIDRQPQPGATNPYAGAGDEVFHEHDTRVFFFDRLMRLLGWELGPGGNVAEEARIKADTTRFVDYVGINATTRAPALILEAKSWDKPNITGIGKWRHETKPTLVVAAVKHINTGGAKDKSPVTGEWHDNLSQLARYVRLFKEQHGHKVPCAVLSSGQWLLIFKTPVATFCESDVNDQQFHLIERDDYVAQAHVIFEQMARVMLADTAPTRIRSSQLANYVGAGSFRTAYHGLLINYEASGSPLFVQQPRILVYPAIFVQRNDNAILTVIDAEIPIVLQLSRTDDGEETLAPHMNEVAAAAATLLASCSAELAISIQPSGLDEFPGFPESSAVAAGGLALGEPRKLLVQPVRTAPNNWLAVTGTLPHYLHEEPVLQCRFHAWSECRAVHCSIGANAVNSPSIDHPRAFFTDIKLHHCAHQTVADRRDDRCHIKAIDARTCCKACAYQVPCWSAAESAALPCGT